MASTAPIDGFRLRNPLLLGEKGKIIAAGVVLGALLFAFFMELGDGKGPKEVFQPVQVDTTPFEPSQHILAKAKDANETDRAQLEEEPLTHLLEKALDITPTVAKALRHPRRTIPVEDLRKDVSSYRGEFLTYKGELEYFSEEQAKHPVYGYKVFQGRLRTKNVDGKPGEPILFFVSKPLPEGTKKGDFVQVDGYFLKLKDEHLLVVLTKAPVIVGKAVEPSYPDWEAIESLDPSVLARVQNAVPLPGDPTLRQWRDTRDVRKSLEDLESIPLWHVASFAKNQLTRRTPEQSDKTPFFERKEQLDAYKAGQIEQGEPIRIRGTLITGRVFEADPNPIGVKKWTEAWVQIPRMGGKILPIWIPRDIRDTLTLGRHDLVECYAYFFKNHIYVGRSNKVMKRSGRRQEVEAVYAPVFVAANLEKFSLTINPYDNYLGIGFVVLILLVMVIIVVMVRGHVKESRKHDAQMVERRRRRRSAASAV